MKSILFKAVLGGSALCASAGVLAYQSFDLGKLEYESSCASCHGMQGKGDGPMRAYLKTPPSDLSTLAARHGGAFPTQIVWEMIDGRASTQVGPHGSREMPVWGQRYRAEALSDPATMAQPEWHVRGRIIGLMDYLSRLQAPR